jgi:argonaute-like protein implicated in RNA metabolism and viral defense
MFMKNTLQKLGPARKAAFSSNEVLLVYPSAYSKDTIQSFYEDCKNISKKFFRTYLPDKPTQYSYPDFNVRKEYESFKNNIDAVLSVIQYNDNTNRYLNFKEWFDKPHQVVTSKVIKEKLEGKQSKYENLLLNVCAGLLGKMGGRPWILEKKLCSDFYIGLDVGGDKRARVACYTFFDGYGNYVREEWRPQRAEEINPQELRRIVVNTIETYSQQQVKSIVFHRDGQFTKGELQGIADIKSELISTGTLAADGKIICVNVKKNTPHRLYEVHGIQQNACKIGSYLLLDDHTGLVANTGVPLLRQGIAQPILVETVPPFDDIPIKTVLEEIYYLSFMHWGSITVKMKLPATLRYADALTPFALKNIRIMSIPL